jgi:hypothetical protein
MLKGVVLAGVVVVLALGALAASGRVNDLRTQLHIKNPFKEVNAALNASLQQQRGWHALTHQADAICARYAQGELVIRKTLPRHRAGYLSALGTAVERERNIEVELTGLQPPSSYERPYSQFLRNRQAALAALERLQKAVKEKSRQEFAPAARTLEQRKRLVDTYAEAAGMPACAF